MRSTYARNVSKEWRFLRSSRKLYDVSRVVYSDGKWNVLFFFSLPLADVIFYVLRPTIVPLGGTGSLLFRNYRCNSFFEEVSMLMNGREGGRGVTNENGKTN